MNTNIINKEPVKKKFFHFYNENGGGVLSVISNIIKFSSNPFIEHHIIFTVNIHHSKNFLLPKVRDAASINVFYYSPKWNFYYTCKELKKFIQNENVFIVSHDWIALGMCSNLGLQNPLIHFLHGDYDYYYELSKKNSAVIDKFICVSPSIFEKMQYIFPDKKLDIHKCYFPVPSIKPLLKNNATKILQLFYIVKNLSDPNKNFALVSSIDKILQQNNIEVSWNIVGELAENDIIGINILKTLQNVRHYSWLENDHVFKILEQMDIFILPSKNEGLPVTLVESMKASLVPLVTNWRNATAELLMEGENGFYIELNNFKTYADKIILLHRNRNLLKTMGSEAAISANHLFNPSLNTSQIEDIILQSASSKKIKNPNKVYGSRLDHPLIPNFITKTIRNFIK